LVSTLSGNIDLDRTMQWDKNYEAALMGLLIEDVNAAVKRHLSLDAMSIIKAGDAKKIDTATEVADQS